jgi:hypothetical protein
LAARSLNAGVRRRSNSGMSRGSLVLLGTAVSVFALLLAALLMQVVGSGGGVSSIELPLATPTVTIVQWDSEATNDTYFDVMKYPNRYQGQAITWTCNVANIFGQDNGDGKTNIGCWEYVGTYDGEAGDGEIILSVPPSINTDNLHIGDDVIARGTIAAPYDGVHPGRRADPGPVVDIWALTNKGHDPNAT